MFEEFMNRTWLDNSMDDYATSAIIFIAGMVVIFVFKRFLLNRFREWAGRTDTEVDDFLLHSVEKKLVPVFYAAILYLGIRNLHFGESADEVIRIIFIVSITLLAIRFVLSVALFVIQMFWVRKERDESKKSAIKGLLTVLKFVIWSVVVVLLLDNLGIKVTTLVAGLGIGGVAIALAAQAILGDLFSYFTIFLDRPFEIGDLIIIDNFVGTVEHIGIKTSRLRSLSGEELVFSNTDLTNSRIRNYKRMDKRREVFNLGVTYETDYQRLREVPGMMREIIDQVEDTEFDRAHFVSYGDFSLNFEIVYYVLSRDYQKYRDVQQEINYQIKKKFEERGVEFAYPTQTLFVENN